MSPHLPDNTVPNNITLGCTCDMINYHNMIYIASYCFTTSPRIIITISAGSGVIWSLTVLYLTSYCPPHVYKLSQQVYMSVEKRWRYVWVCLWTNMTSCRDVCDNLSPHVHIMWYLSLALCIWRCGDILSMPNCWTCCASKSTLTGM